MNVEVTPLSILIEAPFHAKDLIKGIRGAQWDRGLKRWCFPNTPHAAQILIQTLGQRFADHDRWKLDEIVGCSFPNYKASAHLPPAFAGLWEHQRRAIDFAWWRPATMLAMEMRTGKTATALALATLWESRLVLVSCPLSVVGVWEAELRRFGGAHWIVARLDRGSVARRTAIAEERYLEARAGRLPLLLIVNHESTWRAPLAEFLRASAWDLLIVDESHRAKAPGGKFSRFLATLSEGIPRRLALTGTPLPHSPLDAYAQYRFLDRSIFGSSYNMMKNRYAITGGYQGHQIVGWQRTEEFSQQFHQIAFQVTTEEAFELPEEMDIRRTAPFEPAARKVYDSLSRNFWAEVGRGEVTASNALAKLLRLQQVTSGYVKNDDEQMVQVSTAKADLLRDFLEDVPTKRPIVIFVRFTKDVEQVREICESQGRVVAEVSGQRKELTDAGTFPEDVDVVVAQIQSGSLGINLSRASLAIFYSWGWSLGDVIQARARIRHSEQTQKLQFVHLVIEDSIDERMLFCLQDRRDFIEDVLDQGRGGGAGGDRHQAREEVRGEAHGEDRAGSAAQSGEG